MYGLLVEDDGGLKKLPIKSNRFLDIWLKSYFTFGYSLALERPSSSHLNIWEKGEKRRVYSKEHDEKKWVREDLGAERTESWLVETGDGIETHPKLETSIWISLNKFNVV